MATKIRLTDINLSLPELALLKRCETEVSAKANLVTLKKRLSKIAKGRDESPRQKKFAQSLLDKLAGKKQGRAASDSPKKSKSKKTKVREGRRRVPARGGSKRSKKKKARRSSKKSRK